MKQVNSFENGIISDIDVSKVKPDQLVFPTVGIRVFNKAGKGSIATLVPGNEELFDLSPGFMMIGGVEYESIGFIFSYNNETGEGEVGTYPSPNMTSTGFIKAYRPIHNFLTYWPVATVNDLRTNLFNFNIHFPVDVVAKKSYDGSVDLYFIDFYNADRVINSGFKLTGESNNRYIRPDNFNGALNHVPFTNTELTVNTVSVDAGGYLKPGNIFLYIKYLTADYGATTFIKEVGPLSIAPGDTQFTHNGLQEKDFSADTILQSDRKITLNLANIDTNFAYMQIGVVRYSATTENGPAQRDIYLISNYYPISGSSKTLTIYGNEPQSLLDYFEVIKTPFLYPISKTQVQIDKRLLKANVKRSALNFVRNDLIAFASRVVVGEFYHDGNFATKTINDYLANGDLYSYQQANNVYQYLGYFKEQVYPFAMIFKFSDGTLSESFPVKGNLSPVTEKGLYKFNDWSASFSGGTPSQNRISGVSFNTSSAHTYYQAHPNSFTDVVGFFFARADRIDNFICQGVVMHGYHGVRETTSVIRSCSFQGEVAADPGNSLEYTTKWNPSDAAIMPLFRGFMPTSHGNGTDYYYGYTDDNADPGTDLYHFLGYRIDGFDGYYNYGGDASTRLHITFPARWDVAVNGGSEGNRSMFSSTERWDNKHGLFSPDLLFDNGATAIPDTAYVKTVFRFGSGALNPLVIGGSSGRHILPTNLNYLGPTDTRSVTGIDLNESFGMNYMTVDQAGGQTDQFVQVNSTRVAHLQSKGKLNFAGYFSSDGTEMGFDMTSTIWNRDIGTSEYVGIEDVSPDHSLRELYTQKTGAVYNPFYEKICTVNLYKNKVNASWLTGINESFDVSSTQYAIVSDLITFAQLSSSAAFYIFKGDCFLQKVWFRTHRWYAMVHNADSNEDQNPPNSGQPAGFGRSFMDKNGNWYQHGFMVGLTVECKYNAGMRNEVIGSTSPYYKYSFFPRAMQTGIDLDQWTAIEPGQYGQEATEINAGYDKVLSDKTVKGYDFTEPLFELNKPNRVYASDVHIPGAFLDGYRSVQTNSYQDFALEDGDITYIGKNLSYPFIVQRNGTNQIFVNEQAVGQTDQGGAPIMGTSLTFFSDRVEKIGWFGCQHKSSIVNGTKGTYGFDFLQSIWWVINTFQYQTGMQKLRMQDLTGELFVMDEVQSMIDQYSSVRDKSDELTDDPLAGSGIVGFADIDNEEVGMTFLLPISTGDNIPVGGRLMRTFIFSEKLGKFYGNYPFYDHIYFNIGAMLLSNHSYLGANTMFSGGNFAYLTGNKMYRYDVKTKADGTPNFATFFEKQEATCISFIVNGASEKENTSELVKIFNSMEVEMKDVKPSSIIFTTQYQGGTYDFATTDFWKLSEYLEHKWRIPVIIQQTDEQDAFQPDSEMRGAWMKVTINFNTSSDIELKSIITDFDISTP